MNTDTNGHEICVGSEMLCRDGSNDRAMVMGFDGAGYILRMGGREYRPGSPSTNGAMFYLSVAKLAEGMWVCND